LFSLWLITLVLCFVASKNPFHPIQLFFKYSARTFQKWTWSQTASSTNRR